MRVAMEWEVPVPELETSVFLVPGDKVKNTEERLVVLNRIARSVIDSVRGMHPQYVFVHKPIRLRAHDREAGVELKPIERMNNTAWRNARAGAARRRVDLLRQLHAACLCRPRNLRLPGAGAIPARPRR